MDTKGSILQYLVEKGVNDPFSADLMVNTTGEIAEQLHISRTLASQYLNELNKEKKVIKIITRPVIYIPVQSFERQFDIHIKEYVFEDIDLYKEWYKNIIDGNDIIGHSGSLIYSISQIQTGLLYPGNGLPILMSGQDGSGKKYLIQQLLSYNIRKNRLSSQWVMKTVCVSDYSNLTRLFSRIKKELENNQILLLYLYSFVDVSHHILTRIVEELVKLKQKNKKFNFVISVNEAEFSILYPALEEQISIVVKVPSLSQRPLQERKAILATLLQKETRQLNKKVFISSKTFEILESLTNEISISALKRIISQTVANAYRSDIQNEDICLNIENLPYEINTDITRKILKNGRKDHKFRIEEMNTKQGTFPFFSVCNDLLKILQNSSLQETDTLSHVTDHIFFMIRTHIDDQMGSYYYEEMKRTVTLQVIQSVTTDFEDDMRIYMPPGFAYLINEVHDIYSISEGVCFLEEFESRQELNDFLNQIRIAYSKSYAVATGYLKQLSQKLSIRFSNLFLILTTICLESFNRGRQYNSIGALIISHGVSTASSISDTANFLLGRKIFTALDMPLNMTVIDIADKVNEYLKFNNIYTYVIILVDMGSLEEIPQFLESRREITYGIINNISTSVALDVGERIKNNQNFYEILEKTVKNIHFEYRIVQPEFKKKAIVIASDMGQRMTSKIAQLFQISIPVNDSLSIVEYNYEQLKDKKEECLVFKEYDVVLVVKPDILSLDFVPSISLEDVIYRQDNDRLNSVLDQYMTKDQIKEFHMNLVKNFTLENVVETLTILNAKHLMDLVVESVERLIQRLNKRIDPRTRIGIYMHICFLVERLVTKNEIQTDQEESNHFFQENPEFVSAVQKSFQNILDSYCVKLPISEIMYLYDYIYEEGKK